jgi:glycosyltransferase involved in cell wall biosynthesis
MGARMKFYIFSYNRGTFLDHCVTSIEKCAPSSPIVIFDDTSNDPHTREVLGRLSQRHRVISSGKLSGHKHGGLYGNMQSALEKMDDDELFCFLQDDMQLVRSINDDDISYIHNFFQVYSDSGFLQPTFLKGATRSKDAELIRYDAEGQVYFREQNKNSAGFYYSDICISTARHLRERGWTFETGEPTNEMQAKRLFPTRMGLMRDPFAMWLPYAPAYRGKQKTLALKLAEKTRNCGFYPFKIMSDAASAELKARPAESLPVAEDYLETINPGLKKPWIYYPLQGSRSFKHLNRLELFLRRLLPR